MTHFAANLIRQMIRRKMSQADICRAIKAPRPVVCRWVNGVQAPSIANLVRLRNALNCTYEQLLENVP